jgi:hypothetical protein
VSVIFDGLADPPALDIVQAIPVRCLCEYHPSGIDALPLAASIGYTVLLLGVALACYAAGRLTRIRKRIKFN